MKKIHIWTDGSCNNKTHKNGGCGIILLYDGHRKEMSIGQYINTTSARMEMRSILFALQAITNKSIPIELYCDNQYVVNGIKKGWAFKWESEGWYNRLNADLWKQILYEYRRFPDGNVRFNWVKGHSNITHNERADYLAKIGSKMTKTMICNENYCAENQ